jgi:hypothetical protein
MKPALLLFLLFLTVPAYARLDETTEQIEARYGKPLSDIKPESPATAAKVYEKNGFHITVGYYEGKSYYEQFRKIDPFFNITKMEQNCLLKANGMQGLWQTGAQNVTALEWHNIAPNGQAEAIYALKVFTIRSIRVENQKEVDEKKREADNLKDF